MSFRVRLVPILIAVATLSISLTVSAVQDCYSIVSGEKSKTYDPQSFISAAVLGYKPTLEFQEPKIFGSLINHTIMAKGPEGEVLGRIEYRVDDLGRTLKISYVVRTDRARGAGLPKAMLAEILNKHPHIYTMVAEFMDVNALVVDRYRRSGIPMEEAVLLAPTAKAAVELGFTNLVKAKDYSFFTEGAYHLTLSRP